MTRINLRLSSPNRSLANLVHSQLNSSKKKYNKGKRNITTTDQIIDQISNQKSLINIVGEVRIRDVETKYVMQILINCGGLPNRSRQPYSKAVGWELFVPFNLKIYVQKWVMLRSLKHAWLTQRNNGIANVKYTQKKGMLN